MSNLNTVSSLHQQAAGYYHEAAKSHLKAAECHDKNNPSNAKDSAKRTTGWCNTAHKITEAACKKTAH